MTIEFNCPQCSQLLKTADDKAGLQARCPGCQMPLVVPELSAVVLEELLADEFTDDEPAAAAGPATAGHSVPRRRPAELMFACPACAERIPAKSRVCKYCGEPLRPPRRTVDIGEILSDAWKIYSENFGLCVGGFLLESLITGAVFAVGVILAVVLIAALAVALPEELAIFTAVLLVLPFWLYVSAYMQAGQHLFNLNLARRADADLVHLAAGGPYAWRLVVNSLVFGALYVLGFLACIIPGLLVLMMYWPFGFALVETDAPGIEALRRAREVTREHGVTSFLVWVVSFGLQMAGAMAMYIGLLFTTPFVALMLAVAYQHMSEVAAERELAR